MQTDDQRAYLNRLVVFENEQDVLRVFHSDKPVLYHTGFLALDCQSEQLVEYKPEVKALRQMRDRIATLVNSGKFVCFQKKMSPYIYKYFVMRRKGV